MIKPNLQYHQLYLFDDNRKNDYNHKCHKKIDSTLNSMLYLRRLGSHSKSSTTFTYIQHVLFKTVKKQGLTTTFNYRKKRFRLKQSNQYILLTCFCIQGKCAGSGIYNQNIHFISFSRTSIALTQNGMATSTLFMLFRMSTVS